MFSCTAKDIMIKDVITVKTDTPMHEAMELVAKYDVSGLPVVDDDMTLVGILSEKDMVNLLYTPDNQHEKTVSDFMTQPAIYFDEDKNLLDVCDFLVKNIFRRVPITSNKKLVGIISIKDVIEAVIQSKQGVPCAE